MTRLFAGTPLDRPPRCERCGQLEDECRCPPEEPPAPVRTPPEKQTAKLTIEKRAKGKRVTVIQGLPAVENDLPALLSRLKTACGAGGTLHEGTIEIQGDQLAQVRATLQQIGYKVRG